MLLPFVLAAMQAVAPELEAPRDLAEAIALASEERAIFPGEDGAKRTAALLVSIAWWESGRSFDGSRVGDHGHSVSVFQLWVCNGPLCARVKSDVRFAATVARDMAEASLRACRHLEKANRLAQFTTGKCVANREARVRWQTAERLVRLEVGGAT